MSSEAESPVAAERMSWGEESSDADDSKPGNSQEEAEDKQVDNDDLWLKTPRFVTSEFLFRYSADSLPAHLAALNRCIRIVIKS
jgi:hypothetical protein